MKRFALISVFICLICIICKATSGDIMLPYYYKQAKNSKLPINERLDFYDSVLNCTKAKPDRLRTLLEKGELCFNVGMLRSAVDVYSELGRDLDPYSQSDQCKILYALSRSYIFINDTQRSLQTINRLREIPKADSLKYYDVLACLVEGVIYQKNRHMDRVVKSLESGKAMLSATQKYYPGWRSNDIRAQLMILEGIVYHAKGKYETELRLLGEAEKISKSSPVKQLINLNRGVIYELLEKYDVAETFYSNILESNPLTHFNTGVVVVNYMGLLIRTHRPEKALSVYDKYRNYTELLKGSSEEGYLYLNLSNIYSLKHDYKRAFTELQRHVNISDSLSRVHDKVLASAAEQELQENADLQHRNDVEKWYYRAVCIALLLIIVVIVLLYVRQRKKKGAEKAISRNDGEGNEENALSAEKKQELTSLALRISHYNELINTIRGNIDSAELSNEDKINVIKQHLRDVKLKDDAWKMFDNYFANTHQRFISRLLSEHPNLTSGELRMCAFVVLNMNTKEIATMTNRSTRTVETTKYRINKKLGSVEPLNTYLNRFME